MTYIAFATKDQRTRYEQECKRLGFPVTDWWPRGTLAGEEWDPAVPESMPHDLQQQAYQFAIQVVRKPDLPSQHPDFKFLRVPADQGR